MLLAWDRSTLTSVKKPGPPAARRGRAGGSQSPRPPAPALGLRRVSPSCITPHRTSRRAGSRAPRGKGRALTERTLMRSGVSSTHAILGARAATTAPNPARGGQRYRRRARPIAGGGGGGGGGGGASAWHGHRSRSNRSAKSKLSACGPNGCACAH